MTFLGEGARPADRRRLSGGEGRVGSAPGGRIPLLGGGEGEEEGAKEPPPDPRSSGAAGELWLLIVSRPRGAGPARGGVLALGLRCVGRRGG